MFHFGEDCHSSEGETLKLAKERVTSFVVKHGILPPFLEAERAAEEAGRHTMAM